MPATDFLCVFGANGAGKTRLVRSLGHAPPSCLGQVARSETVAEEFRMGFSIGKEARLATATCRGVALAKTEALAKIGYDPTVPYGGSEEAVLLFGRDRSRSGYVTSSPEVSP